MLIALLLCGSGQAQQFEWGSGKVTYRGNTFECGRPHMDTVVVEDPVTNDQLVKYVQNTPEPQTMNGQKIYKLAELSETNTAHDDGSPVEEYVINGLKPELAQLPDGQYALCIETVVADQLGRIVYYFFPGLRSTNRDKPTPAGVQSIIMRRVDELMASAPSVKPGLVGEQPAIFITGVFDHTYLVNLRHRNLVIEKTQ